MRKYLQVEDVVAEFLRLLGSHDLDMGSPRRIVSLVNRFEQILSVPVRVLASHLDSLFVGESLFALVGEEVDLDIDKRSVFLNPLESL